MVKLYFFRKSQYATLIDANLDGAVRYVGTFENSTQGDMKNLLNIRYAVKLAEEALCGTDDDIKFVEVTDA